MGEELIPPTAAVEDPAAQMDMTVDQWLQRARTLVATALQKAREAKGYPSRWKVAISKLEQVPTSLLDLSSHPFFGRNALCREQLQGMCGTLLEAADLASRCAGDDAIKQMGKLQMQSDLDAVIGKLDLGLRDCRLLVKTGVLGEATPAPGTEQEAGNGLRELLARLQIGDMDAKHRAVDGLLECMMDDEKSVFGVLGRSSIAAIINLLGATSARIREKAAIVVCRLAESGNCENFLVSEGALPLLIRLADSGNLVVREKAVASLQRLSMLPEIARLIAGHGGIRPLIEVCLTGDSACQAAAAGVLKNLSLVPEIRQNLAEEGTIKVMIDLLDCGMVAGSKEYAVQCLQNLTASNESLRRAVVTEGGVHSLLAYIDGPVPQESSVSALKNLVECMPAEGLIRLGLLARLVHVLDAGSLGAKQAAASTICKISGSLETKRSVGESGCLPLLVKLLEAKSSSAKEAAAQAISSLMGYQQNARELKRDEKSVPNLVQLLDPNPLNAAKKYAVTCLLAISSSKRCKKLMVSHGAIGYLKKLGEMEVPGARKLLERLDHGRLRRFFSRR